MNDAMFGYDHRPRSVRRNLSGKNCGMAAELRGDGCLISCKDLFGCGRKALKFIAFNGFLQVQTR